MKKKILAIFLTLTLMIFGGCASEKVQNSDPTQNNVVYTSMPVAEETPVDGPTVDKATTVEEEKKEAAVAKLTVDKATTPIIEPNNVPVVKEVEVLSMFKIKDVPPFAGVAYVEVNNNIPYFTNKTTNEEFEKYSPLDELGRCGVAYANICPNLMPTKPRESIGMVQPSGWRTIRYDGLIDGNYLYNRCHLIAYELSGENANVQNLITGTRYLNVQGMLPFENKVADYVKQTGNHVLYRVTPIFEGNNLVASGVLMEGYSVEDGGHGISYCVYCYNAQPGININYANGDSYLIETPAPEPTVTATPVTSTAPEPAQNETPTQYDYIVNINSRKFHYPSCSSANSMKESNKWYYHGTREYLIEHNFEPCKNCKP